MMMNFGLLRPFRSLVGSRHAKDGQTDKQTDGQTLYVSFYNAPFY